jgi:hypothetical protein
MDMPLRKGESCFFRGNFNGIMISRMLWKKYAARHVATRGNWFWWWHVATCTSNKSLLNFPNMAERWLLNTLIPRSNLMLPEDERNDYLWGVPWGPGVPWENRNGLYDSLGKDGVGGWGAWDGLGNFLSFNGCSLTSPSTSAVSRLSLAYFNWSSSCTLSSRASAWLIIGLETP